METRARVMRYLMDKYGVMLPQACSILDTMDPDQRGELYESMVEAEEVEYVLLA